VKIVALRTEYIVRDRSYILQVTLLNILLHLVPLTDRNTARKKLNHRSGKVRLTRICYLLTALLHSRKKKVATSRL
jgi:hypothetical protein